MLWIPAFAGMTEKQTGLMNRAPTSFYKLETCNLYFNWLPTNYLTLFLLLITHYCISIRCTLKAPRYLSPATTACPKDIPPSLGGTFLWIYTLNPLSSNKNTTFSVKYLF